MPQQLTTSVENNFTKGLITESTGLNFPENASTDTDNCSYDLIGNVFRRQGIDFEVNGTKTLFNRSAVAVSTYRWNNAGGDGQTQIFVQQIGTTLRFWKSSNATVNSPLSDQRIAYNVDISAFVVSGGSFNATLECQFSDGNGYLFVYHPNCEPFYCTFASGVITSTPITVQIRDFTGVLDISGVSARPLSLTQEHLYNLVNQGWTQGAPWQGQSTTLVTVDNVGSRTFTVASGMTVTLGDRVNILNAHDAFPGGILVPAGTIVMSGTVTAYAGTSLTILLNSCIFTFGTSPYGDWLINPISSGYIDTWKTGVGNYPANSDVWWFFKNASGVFSPSTTVANVTLNTGPSPKGHTKLNAFNLQRSLASGVSGITPASTLTRPTTGTWFQGRVWFAGVNAQQPAAGDIDTYSWTENIYFSQIVNTPFDFGSCYQTNDPTSETLFDLLPTDGGVIQIQGCGAVYKLFPIQNGLLVFAANGVWFITGSQGIGFAANDYTTTKISSVQSISSTSFVDVQGLPYFWNEEGIYAVQPIQGGGLSVEPLTVGTILSFYNQIPATSKKYVRGAYHPIDYIVQWVYRDTNEEGVTTRYEFNRILNYNTYNKAFFPYSISGPATINGINYISSPSGITAPEPGFKYSVSYPSAGSYFCSFGDEHDADYVDWASVSPTNFVSFFVTGYKLRGQAIKRFQPQYIQVYSRTNGEASGYKIQGIWDYSNNRNSGRWSNIQLVTNALSRYDLIYRRHKIRGHGFALQFKIISSDGLPFDIAGWAVVDTVNAGT